VIANEADRLARTVNDILWTSRLGTDSLHVAIEQCDAAALARDIVTAAEIHRPANIELVLAVADGVPPVAADPDKVRQVLANLVDNAVKYSPDGGRVDVAVDSSRAASGSASATAASASRPPSRSGSSTSSTVSTPR
jgi:signal transduction histidine kinase